MWVARNKDGELNLFHGKPIFVYEGIWVDPDTKEFEERYYGFSLNDKLFPNLNWNDEPEEVVLEIRKPQEDDDVRMIISRTEPCGLQNMEEI